MPDGPRASSSRSAADAPGIDVLAGLLAVVFPGAGHAAKGDRLRGLYIALGVLGLFVSGLLVGGIDAVDSREDRLWFIGQAFVGPLAFGVDYVHQSRFKAYDPAELADPPTGGAKTRTAFAGERRITTTANGRNVHVWQPTGDPDADPPSRKSLAKINELASLITTLAGMVNFIAIIDALLPGRVGSRTGAKKDEH